MKYFLTYGCLCFLLLTGCDSDSLVVPAMPTGHLAGTIKTYSVFRENPDHRGTLVEIVGTEYKTMTDSLGNWRFNAIPYGIYELLYTHTGYLPKKKYNVVVKDTGVNQFLDTSRYESHGMSPIPDYLRVTNPALRSFARVDTMPYYLATFSFRASFDIVDTSQINGVLGVEGLLLFSRDSLIDPRDGSTYQYGIADGFMNMHQGQQDSLIEFEIYSHLLAYNGGYQTGDTIYCIGYVLPSFLRTYYFDPYLNNYPIVGCSPHSTGLMKFTMP